MKRFFCCVVAVLFVAGSVSGEADNTAASRQMELERLQMMEREADEAKQREREEIAGKEMELVALNREINDMKGKFWLSNRIPAKMKQRDEQANYLEKLRKQHEAAEKKRRQDIAQLRDEAKTKLVKQISMDLTKYQKSSSSQHERDMNTAAWKAMTDGYPEAREVKTGDIDGFLKVMGMTRFGGEIVSLEDMMREIDKVTYTDPHTGFMWPKMDNGSDISWPDAMNYCRSFRLGGFSDWRLPTRKELAGLYDAGKSYQAAQRNYNVHLTDMIRLSTCCLWASDFQGSEAAVFDFSYGTQFWLTKTYNYGYRVLPVRKAKEVVGQPPPAGHPH